MAFAILAESDPGRYRDAGLFQQELGELEAAEMSEHIGDRRPGEHGGRRRRDRPAGAGERIDQTVAAAAIDGANVVDAVLRAVERRRGGDLDRGVGAVIEVGFDPRQRMDQPLIANGEADAPTRHGVGL